MSVVDTIRAFKTLDNGTKKKENEKETNEIRVMQWNLLARALFENNQKKFFQTPTSLFNWEIRKNLIFKEFEKYNSDIICLEELDFRRDIGKHLEEKKYEGIFFSKYNSPCVDKPINYGPDGCAIFYKYDKFDYYNAHFANFLNHSENANKNTNQVFMILTLRHKKTERFLTVVCLHLKADEGKESKEDLRNLQVEYLLKVLKTHLSGIHDIDKKKEKAKQEVEKKITNQPQNKSKIPVIKEMKTQNVENNNEQKTVKNQKEEEIKQNTKVGEREKTELDEVIEFKRHAIIICGDFNGESSEKWYNNLKIELNLENGYEKSVDNKNKQIPTTIKIKKNENGKIDVKLSTLDYIFYTKEHFSPLGYFELPILTKESKGLPNESCPSDHYSLVCDFGFK